MFYFDKTREFVIDSFEKAGKGNNIKHLERTAYWLKQLKPDADEAMLIAAISHDIERALRDSDKKPTTEQHQEKGAEIIDEFLEKQNAPREMIDKVKNLISKHEIGGTDEENLIKDADSISFLENQVDIFIACVPQETSKEKTLEKFNLMYNRISSPEAKKLAEPFYKNALDKLGKIYTSYLGKTAQVLIERPIGSNHPKYGFKYEVNYGHIPDTLAPDGEEIDAYVLGIDKPLEKFSGKCIAIIHRLNDNDDKLVIIPENIPDISDEEILNLTNFQEKWFKSIIIREKR